MCIDQQCDVCIFECNFWIVGDYDVCEQWECVIVEFYYDVFDGGLGLWEVEQLQDDWLIFVEQVVVCDVEQQGVSDLICGVGDGNVFCGFSY